MSRQKVQRCEKCRGTGWQIERVDPNNVVHLTRIPCVPCNGLGFFNSAGKAEAESRHWGNAAKRKAISK